MSIRLRPGGLSFSGYAPSEAESFFYREVEFDRAVPFLSSLQEFFFANECLSWAYKRVHVVSVSAGYTIVPRSFFREEEKGRLLDFNFAVPSPFCRSQSLAGEEAELVYPMDEDVYKFCSRSLSRPFFSHYLVPLLDLWKKRSRSVAARQMYVVVEKGRMDVACYASGGGLLFVNTFPISRADDRMYYILYVWKEVGLDPREDQLLLSGEPRLTADLGDSLRMYLRHVQPMEIPSETYLWGTEVAKAPLDVISLFVCES